MEALYITNYCDRRCSPLHSITRLPVGEAYALAKELSRHTTSSFNSFSRFSERDFDGYYKKRLRTEEWLYASFVALGGRPKSAHPLYFVLGESTYLHNWFGNGIITRLALDDIAPCDVSFTYGDSMSKMDAPDRHDLFDKRSLFEFIGERSDSVAAFLAGLNKANRYIEAQLWNDEYVKEALAGRAAR